MLSKIKNMNFNKKIYGSTFLISFLSLLSAFMLEWFAGFEPCFLCWTQRFGFALVLLLSMIFFFKIPKKTFTKIFSHITIMLSSFFGMGVAIRHIYITKNPEASSCGFGPDMVFDMLPFTDAIMQFFIGSTSCTKVEGILGIPFPYWALMLFSLIALISVLGSFKALSRKNIEK